MSSRHLKLVFARDIIRISFSVYLSINLFRIARHEFYFIFTRKSSFRKYKKIKKVLTLVSCDIMPPPHDLRVLGHLLHSITMQLAPYLSFFKNSTFLDFFRRYNNFFENYFVIIYFSLGNDRHLTEVLSFSLFISRPFFVFLDYFFLKHTK